MNYDSDNYDSAQWDIEKATAPYLPNGYDASQWDGDPAQGQRWVIGADGIRVVDVTLSPTSLELSVRVRSASERALLAELDENSGETQERPRASGVIEYRDAAGGANTYRVRPPLELRPPRIEREWLVEEIDRDRTSADTRATAASVTFVPAGARSPVAGNTDSGSDWSFAFSAGTVITPRVSNIRQRETTQLDAYLFPRQAELFESVAPAVGGAVEDGVPDNETVVRDTTPDSRQTVEITPPASAEDPAITAGEYVVFGWSSEGSDGGAYRVRMELEREG